MKITKIQTLSFPRGIQAASGLVSWLWVRIYSDESMLGLGETYPAAATVESVIRHTLAPALLGQDPRQIDRLWADMSRAVGRQGWAGAEMRAISAVDMALWDLLGKVTWQPVYQLLGGKSRDLIRTSNTCYDDTPDFHYDADNLARDLLGQGIQAMTIWPFDAFARGAQGQHITAAELQEGLKPVRKIREAVGDKMEIAIAFHGGWNLPSAVKIVRALEPYGILWLEEMLTQDNLAAWRSLKQETKIPLAMGKRLTTRAQFREVLDHGLAQFLNPDLCVCGGISEAKKIASLAETYGVPIVPHNCGGPILHFASLHLAANVTNLGQLESVRQHYQKAYSGLVTRSGAPLEGWFEAPEGPGLGVDLAPTLFSHPELVIQTIEK